MIGHCHGTRSVQTCVHKLSVGTRVFPWELFSFPRSAWEHPSATLCVAHRSLQDKLAQILLVQHLGQAAADVGIVDSHMFVRQIRPFEADVFDDPFQYRV